MREITITMSDEGEIFIWEGTPQSHGLERYHATVDYPDFRLHCHFFSYGVENVMLLMMLNQFLEDLGIEYSIPYNGFVPDIPTGDAHAPFVFGVVVNPTRETYGMICEFDHYTKHKTIGDAIVCNLPSPIGSLPEILSIQDVVVINR